MYLKSIHLSHLLVLTLTASPNMPIPYLTLASSAALMHLETNPAPALLTRGWSIAMPMFPLILCNIRRDVYLAAE